MTYYLSNNCCSTLKLKKFMKKFFGVILFYCPFILISCKKSLSTNVESKSVTTSVASELSSSDQYLVDVFLIPVLHIMMAWIMFTLNLIH